MGTQSQTLSYRDSVCECRWGEVAGSCRLWTGVGGHRRWGPGFWRKSLFFCTRFSPRPTCGYRPWKQNVTGHTSTHVMQSVSQSPLGQARTSLVGRCAQFPRGSQAPGQQHSRLCRVGRRPLWRRSTPRAGLPAAHALTQRGGCPTKAGRLPHSLRAGSPNVHVADSLSQG